MSLDTLFSLAGALALLGWATLILLPHRPRAGEIVAGVAVPTLLGIAYAGLVAAFWFPAEGGFGSLDAVAMLFASRGLLLAGWLHYLAFDLLVGTWIARTARAEAIPHVAVVPSLVLTFLFGPVGFLLFFLTRLARRFVLLPEARYP